MGLIILAALVITPIVEIAVFIEIGGRIGVGNTVGVVLLTALAGTALLRHQGLAVLRRAQETLHAERFPLDEVFEGLCLLVAGALLLTPGFVTDGFGFLLFLPPFRRALRPVAVNYLSTHGTIVTDGPQSQPSGRGTVIIDGEFEDVTAHDRPTENPAGDEPPRLEK